jgi:anti-sigma regulatory factor (Ser/Thr protein kinase)
VSGVPIACVQLPPSVESVPAARSCTAAALGAWGLPESVLDDVALLLTELTANAVRHGRGVVSVELDLDGDRLTVRVCDGAEAAPLLKHASVEDEGGRGLWLVEAIADSWGWDAATPGGKVVWFEVVAATPSYRRLAPAVA